MSKISTILGSLLIQIKLKVKSVLYAMVILMLIITL